jgi:signal transduction histidine kinase
MSEFAFTGLIGALPWLAGAALRARIRAALAADTRARRAEDEREQHAAAAVAEERARIARELHDLVAHSVSVMVMQAGVLRRRLPDDDRSRDLAQTIERTGREALVEMRRMLGLLRNQGSEPVPLAPLPGLARLNELVESTQTAGVPVELSVDAAPGPLPPGLDLCAYRIVQESLTNVIKHAGRASARVSVRFPPGSVELEVVDDGPGGAITAHGGHGLVGMRERAALFGGQVEAGPGRTGGFAVHALLPMEAR